MEKNENKLSLKATIILGAIIGGAYSLGKALGNALYERGYKAGYRQRDIDYLLDDLEYSLEKCVENEDKKTRELLKNR